MGGGDVNSQFKGRDVGRAVECPWVTREGQGREACPKGETTEIERGISVRENRPMFSASCSKTRKQTQRQVEKTLRESRFDKKEGEVLQCRRQHSFLVDMNHNSNSPFHWQRGGFTACNRRFDLRLVVGRPRSQESWGNKGYNQSA